MKKTFVLSLLFRSLLLASLSSLLACSSILQASRVNRPLAQLPAEIVADELPESVNETILFVNNVQQLYADAALLSPIPMAPGFQWVFVVKQRSPNCPNTGYWQIKPIN